MFWNAFLLALREIRRNMMRSLLTVLGIVIGVASVIAMVILGEGTTAYVTQNITKLGSNMLIVVPGSGRAGGTTNPFKASDILLLKREVLGINELAPGDTKGIKAVYGNKNKSTIVSGSDNHYFSVRDWQLASGRKFSQHELQSGKTVCIIGESVKNELFNNQNPLDAKIRLQNFSCQVIGVLEAKGGSGFGSDQDDLIIVPTRMFQRRISGNQDLKAILISLKNSASTEEVKQEIKTLLRERRHIRKGDDDDFSIHDMKEIVKTLSSTTEILTLLLGAVAAISLLVGGIGIMNIMLVSVTERTHEIGIRLAIGALEREVLLQFLVESVVLSSIGGVIGIILGLSLALIGTSAFSIPFIFNQNIILIAFLFSMIVGVLFGYSPARKAARMDPIEALRHE